MGCVTSICCIIMSKKNVLLALAHVHAHCWCTYDGVTAQEYLESIGKQRRDMRGPARVCMCTR